MKKSLFLLTATLSLTGCLPMYQPVDPSKTVLVKSNHMTEITLCENNKEYALKTDREGSVRVPYGHRIWLTNYYSREMTNSRVFCYPQINFIPQRGQQYYNNFTINGDLCVVEILRYSKKSNTGLVPEKSFSRDQFCGTTQK